MATLEEIALDFAHPKARVALCYGDLVLLISAFEGQLGLASPKQSDVLRAVRLLGRLEVSGAFWAQSATKDPLAAALRLLRWNEELRLAGWQGQGVSQRLEQLAKLMEGAEPGGAERTSSVIEALKVQDADLECVELIGISRGELPVLFRRLLEALEAKGTVITETPIEPVTGKGDLARCLSPGYSPAGTGELRMIRPQGPLTAADLVAAWLAGLGDLEGTVVIGGDEILDNALRRYGLPVLGAGRASGSDPLLQVLPLVVALGWLPQDPHLALELLSLPESPVPPSIASGLIKALRQWPAIGSSDWKKAIVKGLEAIPEQDRRKRVEERLGILLAASATGEEYLESELERRVGALETWAKGKHKNAGEQAPRWDCMLQQLASFRKLCRTSGLESLSRPLLQKLVKAATEQASLPPVRTAEAGIESVSEPGAILCPVRRVVWWNFTERSAPSVERLMLTPEEKASLEALGCEFPEPAVQAAQLSRAWRRPVQMATDAVLLVCPKFGADGEPESPHSLWDEIVSGLGNEQVARLQGDLPPGVARSRAVPGLAVPEPKREWHIDPGVRISHSRPFSPSSLELLLGNPLYWVLKYPCGLSYGASDPLSEGVLVMGSLAHKIAGDLLAECTMKALHDPGHASEQAGRRFDEDGPSMAADFFLPGRERERARLRGTIVGLTQDLFSHIREAGATVAAVETLISAEIDGISLSGRPDLVLSSPDIVLDMKWGRESDRKKELEQGGALQLSVYVALLKRPHSIGYYISSRRRLLLCNPGRFDCARIEGPAPSEVWDAARAVLEERLEQFERGIVEDTCALVDGNSPPKQSCMVEGRLVIAPKPEWSPYSWISNGMAGS